MKFLVLLAAFVSFSLSAEELTKVRIGWLTSWPVQGQLMQIWKHTDILKNNGLEGEFKGALQSSILESAINGELDVVTAGDRSAITLFAAEKGWKAVGRLQYSRTAIYVPVNSPVKSIKELKGKTIGVPIGTTAEKDLLEELKRAKLDPANDVKIENLEIQQQPNIATSKTANWEKYDAMAGFDPVPALLEGKGLARNLSEKKVVGLLLANEEFLKKNKKIEQKLLKALTEAYKYYAKNKKEADDWFLAEAAFKDPSYEVLGIASAIEPNIKGKTIQVKLGPGDLKSLQATADFMQPQLKKKIDVKKFVVK